MKLALELGKRGQVLRVLLTEEEAERFRRQVPELRFKLNDLPDEKQVPKSVAILLGMSRNKENANEFELIFNDIYDPEFNIYIGEVKSALTDTVLSQSADLQKLRTFLINYVAEQAKYTYLYNDVYSALSELKEKIKEFFSELSTDDLLEINKDKDIQTEKLYNSYSDTIKKFEKSFHDKFKKLEESLSGLPDSMNRLASGDLVDKKTFKLFMKELLIQNCKQLIEDNLHPKQAENTSLEGFKMMLNDKIKDAIQQKIHEKNNRVKFNEFVYKSLLPLDKSDKSNLQKIFLDQEFSYTRYIIKDTSNNIKIRLPDSEEIMTVKRIVLYKGDEDDQMIIDVTTDTGKKHFLKSNSEEAFLIFKNHPNVIVDLEKDRRTTERLSASNWNNLSVYATDKSIERDYQLIHAEIQRNIINHIDTKNSKPVEIFFIGCGQGKEIIDVIKQLKKNNIDFVVYGVDYDAHNIQTANKSIKEFMEKEFPGKKQKVFLEGGPEKGDANTIDKRINEFRKQANVKTVDNPDGIECQKTITISSGFLTRLVNEGSREAAEIFQKAASFSDVILQSGRTEGIIPLKFAKRCGITYSMPTDDMNSKTSFYHYRTSGDNSYDDDNSRLMQVYYFVPPEKQAALLASSIKYGALDMQGNARSLLVLSKLKQQYPQEWEKIKSIKLVDAYLKPGELQTLLTLTGDKEIHISGQEPWYKSLTGEIPAAIKVDQRAILSVIMKGNSTMFKEYPKSENLEQRAQSEINRLETSAQRLDKFE